MVRTVHAPGMPFDNAVLFTRERHTDGNTLNLHSQGATFFTWNGRCWEEVETGALRSDLYSFFSDAEYVDGEGRAHTFGPNRTKVADLLEALAAVPGVFIPATVCAPTWIDREGEVPAKELVACQNGLVHFPTRTLLPHTPRFYTHHASPFDFDADAPDPKRWLSFLDELWGNDTEAITTLQEMFGYIVSGDTSLQKMFLIIGPKRSGKGTLARVLTAMIGAPYVASPTLAAMGTNFGLSPLIGKSLAIVSDARLHDGGTAVTEHLLRISGEDHMQIDRKYREPWSGRLSTRIMVMSNEIPRLTDSAGALASRFVMLTMQHSFYGKENPTLTEELLEELPGIFNWALEGLASLRARGRFREPGSSERAKADLEDLGAPVAAFVRDRCEVRPGQRVHTEELYSAWRQWCLGNGWERPTTKQVFGRDLRAAFPGISISQPRTGEGRVRFYEGIGLVARDGTRSNTPIAYAREEARPTIEKHAFQPVPDGCGRCLYCRKGEPELCYTPGTVAR